MKNKADKNMFDEELLLYYKQISKNLITSRAAKRKFISELAGNIDTYRELHPTIGISGIMDEFGSPEIIAEGFHTDFLNQYKRRKAFRKIAKIVLIALFAIFVIADSAVRICNYFEIKELEAKHPENRIENMELDIIEDYWTKEG